MSLFIPPENIRKPEAFWCFQGVWKETSGMIWVNKNYIFFLIRNYRDLFAVRFSFRVTFILITINKAIIAWLADVTSKVLFFFHNFFQLTVHFYIWSFYLLLLLCAFFWTSSVFFGFFVVTFCLILCHLHNHGGTRGDISEFYSLTIRVILYWVCQE